SRCATPLGGPSWSLNGTNGPPRSTARAAPNDGADDSRTLPLGRVLINASSPDVRFRGRTSGHHRARHGTHMFAGGFHPWSPFRSNPNSLAPHGGSKPFAFRMAAASGDEMKRISARPTSCSLLPTTIVAAYSVLL